jgi:hypothetical protein
MKGHESTVRLLVSTMHVDKGATDEYGKTALVIAREK